MVFPSRGKWLAVLCLASAVWGTGGPSARAAATMTWLDVGPDWGMAMNWSTTTPSGNQIALFKNVGSYNNPPLVTSAGTLGGIWDDSTGSASLTIGGANTLTLGEVGINGDADAIVEMATTAGPLTINAPVNLSSTTNNAHIYNYSSYPLTFSGVISGVTGLMTTASGVVVLANSNTYTGDTYVELGTLQVVSAGGLGPSNSLYVDGGTAQLTAANTMSGSTSQVQINGGLLQLTNPAALGTASGGIHINVSKRPGPQGTLDLRYDSSTTFAGADVTFPDAAIAAATSATINVDQLSGGTGTNNTLGIGALLLKGSNSTLNVTGAHGYGLSTGTLTINPNSNSSFTINANVPLTMAGMSYQATSSTLTFSGSSSVAILGSTTFSDSGAILNNISGGTLTLGPMKQTAHSRTVTLGGTGTTLVTGGANNGAYVLSLTKQDPGTVDVVGSCTYTGTTSVSGGVLNLSASLGNTPIFVTGGTLGLLSAGAVTQNTLTLNGGALSETASNALGGGAALAVNGGSAYLTLSNSYTGGTKLNAGTLVAANGMTGSALGSGTLTINGGTLAAGPAGGTIAGLVQAGSGPHTIAPGAGLSTGYGTLNLNGGLTTNNNTTLAFNLNLGAAIGGSTYGGDLINLGSAGLSGSGSITFTINPSNAGDYRLIGRHDRHSHARQLSPARRAARRRLYAEHDGRHGLSGPGRLLPPALDHVTTSRPRPRPERSTSAGPRPSRPRSPMPARAMPTR